MIGGWPVIDLDAMVLPAMRDTFGEPVTVQRQSGGPVSTVLGVFQDAYAAEVFDANGPRNITVAPNVGVRIADVGWSPKPRDIVTRAKDGTRYVVTEDKPDGLGWVSLHLKVAP